MNARILAAMLLLPSAALSDSAMQITSWQAIPGASAGIEGQAAQPIICPDGFAQTYVLMVQCFGSKMSISFGDQCEGEHRMFVMPTRPENGNRTPIEVTELSFKTLMNSLSLLVSVSPTDGIPQSALFDLRKFPLAIYANRSECTL